MATLAIYCDGYAEGSCTRRPHRMTISSKKLNRARKIKVPKCFQCGLRGVKALTLALP